MKRYLLQCLAVLAVLGMFPLAGALIEGSLPAPAALSLLVLAGLAARGAARQARRQGHRAAAARALRHPSCAARPAGARAVRAPLRPAASQKAPRPALWSA